MTLSMHVLGQKVSESKVDYPLNHKIVLISVSTINILTYQYGAVGNDAKCCFIFRASLYDEITPGFPTFASNKSFALRL